ncbi:hypothetical protein M413DRAFT_29411 [Hebeloma cylindrosporum]|uniref:Protein kinase domain-containing protein n=1 Tax=Hebeloma cylindrosporum TaxID=76867 RepID=A0A0C3C4Q0_HEBCY|nr:hypothetical protein M413DRAFT_29411 [Hebeloma cylindrosporum h7]
MLLRFPVVLRVYQRIAAELSFPTVRVILSSESVSAAESAESIRAKLPNSREWRCPSPVLGEAGNYAGDAYWRALSPVLNDAGFILWKHEEGFLWQCVKAGGEPLVNGFGYLIPYRAHATAIGGGVKDLRISRYLDIVFGIFPKVAARVSDMVGLWAKNSVGDVLGMIMQMLEGLAFIHDKSIAHRDVFLDNFLVKWHPESLATNTISPSRPRVYLIDFETAVEFAPELHRMTKYVPVSP